MMDSTRSHEIPCCTAIDLAEIQMSTKISSWIWSIISGVVTVLGRRGRGAIQVENHHVSPGPIIFWRWHTIVHVLIMFLSEWREFISAPCLAGKKINDRSMLLKSRASPDMLPFNLCNKKKLAIRQMNWPLFPKTLSILSYEIGK